MLRSVLPLLATLIAVLALEARAQTQVASLSGALPPEPEIGAFTAVTNTVERRYDDLAFALGERGRRTYANEAVRALEASSASIRLDDGTVLDVGPNSEITLDSFIYDPERGEQRLSLRFLSGIVRFTTGSMEKQAYEINTPVGSLTIRGTEFTLLMEEALHLVLNEGAITLELSSGEERDLDASDPDNRFLSVVAGSFIDVADTDRLLTKAMNALKLTFDRPTTHSSVVSDYMTAFFNHVTLETCAGADACLVSIGQHFERLCDLGVLRAEARRSLARIVEHIDERAGLTNQTEVLEKLFEGYDSMREGVDSFPVTYGEARRCDSMQADQADVQVSRVKTQSGGNLYLRIDRVGAEALTPLQAVQPSFSGSGNGSTASNAGDTLGQQGGSSNNRETPGKVADPGTGFTSPGITVPIVPIIPITPIQIVPIQIVDPISPPTLVNN
jgi:hypothetical protein